MNTILDLLEQEEPKDVIYHYTTQKGFLGIIETKSIWASQVSCLNDSSEINFSFDTAIELLEERKDENEGSFSEVFDVLKTFFPNIFVCSFSEKSDLLSQWRAYGKNTNGLSIGFNTQALKKEAENQGFILAKCVYDEDSQKALLTRAIDEFFSDPINYIPKDIKVFFGEDEEYILKTAFLIFLMKFAPIIKNQGFQEEAEWRLISIENVPIEKIFFRSGNSFIIPYYKFNLGDLNNILDEIIVGPTPYKEIAINSVSMVLEKSHFKPKPLFSHENEFLRTTSIPYRNW